MTKEEATGIVSELIDATTNFVMNDIVCEWASPETQHDIDRVTASQIELDNVRLRIVKCGVSRFAIGSVIGAAEEKTRIMVAMGMAPLRVPCSKAGDAVLRVSDGIDKDLNKAKENLIREMISP